jgi:hypothetical protein
MWPPHWLGSASGLGGFLRTAPDAAWPCSSAEVAARPRLCAGSSRPTRCPGTCRTPRSSLRAGEPRLPAWRIRLGPPGLDQGVRRGSTRLAVTPLPGPCGPAQQAEATSTPTAPPRPRRAGAPNADRAGLAGAKVGCVAGVPAGASPRGAGGGRRTADCGVRGRRPGRRRRHRPGLRPRPGRGSPRRVARAGCPFRSSTAADSAPALPCRWPGSGSLRRPRSRRGSRSGRRPCCASFRGRRPRTCPGGRH